MNCKIVKSEKLKKKSHLRLCSNEVKVISPIKITSNNRTPTQYELKLLQKTIYRQTDYCDCIAKFNRFHCSLTNRSDRIFTIWFSFIN